MDIQPLEVLDLGARRPGAPRMQTPSSRAHAWAIGAICLILSVLIAHQSIARSNEKIETFSNVGPECGLCYNSGSLKTGLTTNLQDRSTATPYFSNRSLELSLQIMAFKKTDLQLELSGFEFNATHHCHHISVNRRSIDELTSSCPKFHLRLAFYNFSTQELPSRKRTCMATMWWQPCCETLCTSRTAASPQVLRRAYPPSVRHLYFAFAVLHQQVPEHASWL